MVCSKWFLNNLHKFYLSIEDKLMRGTSIIVKYKSHQNMYSKVFDLALRELENYGIDVEDKDIHVHLSEELRYNADDLYKYGGMRITVEDSEIIFHEIYAPYAKEFFGYQEKPEFRTVCKGRFSFPSLAELTRIYSRKRYCNFLGIFDCGNGNYALKNPSKIINVGSVDNIHNVTERNALVEIVNFCNKWGFRAHSVVWAYDTEYSNIYVYDSEVEGEVDLVIC